MTWKKGDKAVCQFCQQLIEHDGSGPDDAPWFNRPTEGSYKDWICYSDVEGHLPSEPISLDPQALLQLERELRQPFILEEA